MPLRGLPTELLIAPDSFKGTFSAAEVAAAVGAGLASAGWPVSLLPVADGGEGTLAVLSGPLGLERIEADVQDPLGRPIRAAFGMAQQTAVVEMARASGLGLVAPAERDAVAASTAGTGQLVLAAIESGAREIILSVGGSATSDGGRGALEVIGALPSGVRLLVLCDVNTPFEAAAAVFGPQKGADRAAVAQLTAALHAFAAELPRDPRGRAMTGAAGGLAGGLWAGLGAELYPGAAWVLQRLDFDRRMRGARAVVVGEGRMDRQSLAGKITGEIATRARQAGVPCHAVVGQNALDRFDQRILDLQVVLEAGTLEALEAAGAELGRRL